MDLAWLSLAALIVVIVVSCTTTLNAGLVAIVFAWILGVYVAPCFGTTIGLKGVVGGFPADLFLTLVGVTLLFTLAQQNGTLDQVARRAVQSCRGNVGMIPIMFFLLALGLASIGPGNIAAAALLGPMAMAIADRTGIPPFLMTLMVAHGAVAGALSPLAPTGIIARDKMSEFGLTDIAGQTFLYNLCANAAVAFVGYFSFGGWRLFGRRYLDESNVTELLRSRGDELAPDSHAGSQANRVARETKFTCTHRLTLAAIATLVATVIGSKIGLDREVHVGMAALVAAIVLILCRAGDEKEAMRTLPWSVILMVCGVTLLTALMEKTGGLDRLTTLVASVSNERSIAGLIALVAGLVSVYSSTSGVVLPAFLPMTPGLAEQLAGDPLAIASSINVGGHLVDVSPLSTIGALCVASASPAVDRRKLFNQVLSWGLSMAAIGAIFCYVFFGLI